MIKLYKIDNNGKVRVWAIDHHRAQIQIEHGLLKGAKQIETEVVAVNQSGRTLAEQIQSRIESRVNKQLDKGYKHSIEEAKSSLGQNAYGLLRPMLAHKFGDVKNIDYSNMWVQSKFNGHRCLITVTENGLVAYSRNGKPIDTIPHILAKLQHLELGTTLDGELYVHGVPLQILGSWIRKRQLESAALRFVCYDVILPVAYAKRFDFIGNRLYGLDNVDVAPSELYVPGRSINDMMHARIADGYEGLILRHGTTGYEVGKRSQSLVKVKQCLDAEFYIVNVHQSSDGWAIFECQCEPNVGLSRAQNTFRVSAPGTMQEKHDAWANRSNLVGKMLTVEFFEWTNDRKPFHPVAIGVRDEVLG